MKSYRNPIECRVTGQIVRTNSSFGLFGSGARDRDYLALFGDFAADCRTGSTGRAGTAPTGRMPAAPRAADRLGLDLAVASGADDATIVARDGTPPCASITVSTDEPRRPDAPARDADPCGRRGGGADPRGVRGRVARGRDPR